MNQSVYGTRNLSDTLSLELPASYKYLNVLGACISEVLTRVEDVTDREIISYNLQLAVHEICTNIVEHAYQGVADGRIKIELIFKAAERRLEVVLSDTGQHFDPNELEEPDLDNGQVRGYGLFLAKSLVDSLTYEAILEGNNWRLSKNL